MQKSVLMRCLIVAALPVAPFAVFAQDDQRDVTPSAGDTIEIRYINTPELNKTRIVRPDG
jgi:hypothetical protein